MNDYEKIIDSQNILKKETGMLLKIVIDYSVYNRPFCNLEKGTRESAAHSDSLYSRKIRVVDSLRLGCLSSKLELLSIYLHLSRVTRSLSGPVSIFTGLFSHLVIMYVCSMYILFAT